MLALKKVMDLLEVSETDAINAIITAISPLQPPVTRQNWLRQDTFGNNAPTTKDLIEKLEESDFSCTLCGSQMRITFDHINGDATNHHIDNLRVLCFSCNRASSRKGTKNTNIRYKLLAATIQLWEESGIFPSHSEIRKAASVGTIGGFTYFLRFLKNRLSKNKDL